MAQVPTKEINAEHADKILGRWVVAFLLSPVLTVSVYLISRFGARDNHR